MEKLPTKNAVVRVQFRCCLSSAACTWLHPGTKWPFMACYSHLGRCFRIGPLGALLPHWTAHKMATSVSALKGQYLNHHTFRFARTQREAGLEWFDWEHRLKPLRPLSHDIAISVVAVAAIVMAFLLFQLQ